MSRGGNLVPLHVSNDPIIIFHGDGGVACKSGYKHTRVVVMNIMDVRNDCILSPSGLNALSSKDNLCPCGKAIGKTTSHNTSGATRLNRMSLTFVGQLLGRGCLCVFVPVRHV